MNGVSGAPRRAVAVCRLWIGLQWAWRSMGLVFAMLACLGPAPDAAAHAVSDSYLRLKLEGAKLRGEWRLALHDLETAVGLDANRDGAITWGELRGRRDDVVRYAGEHLRLAADGRDLALDFAPALQVDPLANGTYAVLRWEAEAPALLRVLTIDYRVFFEVNALHRGLVLIEHPEGSEQRVFKPGSFVSDVVLGMSQPVRDLGRFIWEGVWHIWLGYDHVLFLITLLLPAVLRREGGRWVPQDSVKRIWIQVLKVVTAFTLAHSVTLSLGALRWVVLPGRWVEVVIAFSIAVAALHNVVPRMAVRTWVVALGFGLVHGFGFASVLADVGLPRDAVLTALLGFNLGVELGQVALVSVFLPVAIRLRTKPWYATRGLPAGSALIAVVALFWVWQRWRGGA